MAAERSQLERHVPLYCLLGPRPVSVQKQHTSTNSKTLTCSGPGDARPDGPPTLAALRKRRTELLAIAASHGATNVRVFGSVARGEARPDSDVDLLVDLEPKRTLFDLSGLILDLEDFLGRKVDVVESGIRPQVGVSERIAREAVLL